MRDPRTRDHDQFRYDPATVARVQERFDVRPVSPATIRERGTAGETLVTADIPDHLGESLAATADAAIALYRLTQLFGTPNVPGLAAGADQPDREATTWQYLFEVGDTEDEADGALLSVYDRRTEPSVGLSTWVDADDDRIAREPTGAPPPQIDLPEETAKLLVQVVLAAVEHSVEATVGGRYV